jgi:hypothetical protein
MMMMMMMMMITPWSTALPEKLRGPHLLKKFSVLWNRKRFITTLTRAHHLSLSMIMIILIINLCGRSESTAYLLRTPLPQGRRYSV